MCRGDPGATVAYRAGVGNKRERDVKIWKKDPERFEAVLSIGWEETGAVVLVLVAVAVMIGQYFIGFKK